MHAMRHHLWHTVDRVLAQPAETSEDQPEAISIKKLRKGDRSWTAHKTLLGWVVDTMRKTLELPPHWKLELAKLLDGPCRARRIKQKHCERVPGKLRFMAAATRLFGALQLALNNSKNGRVPVNRELKDHLCAFARLAADVGRQPTHLAEIVEIVPQDPGCLGATDAAKVGVGGIFCNAEGTPHVWRVAFPAEV